MTSKLTVVTLLFSTLTCAQSIQCLPVGWPCEKATDCCVYASSISCCMYGICEIDDICGYAADDSITTSDELTTPMEEDDIKSFSEDTEQSNIQCIETGGPCMKTTDCCFHQGSGWCPICSDDGICAKTTDNCKNNEAIDAFTQVT